MKFAEKLKKHNEDMSFEALNNKSHSFVCNHADSSRIQYSLAGTFRDSSH